MKTCTKCSIKKEIDYFPITGKGYISNKCKICTEEYKKEWKSNNLQKVIAVNNKWKEENREHYLKSLKITHIKNSKNNEYILKRKNYNSKFNKENPHVGRNASAKRRAKTKNATIGNYRDELLNIYKNCPIGYHVDHIIPLNNDKISGLHVPWNLQYLSAEDNLKKSNTLCVTTDIIRALVNKDELCQQQ